MSEPEVLDLFSRGQLSVLPSNLPIQLFAVYRAGREPLSVTDGDVLLSLEARGQGADRPARGAGADRHGSAGGGRPYPHRGDSFNRRPLLLPCADGGAG